MKRKYAVLAAILAVCLMGCLTACASFGNGANGGDADAPVDAPVSTPAQNPDEAQHGATEDPGSEPEVPVTYPDATTETFTRHDLTVQVTNVRERKTGTRLLMDGRDTEEYDIFVVYPGAELTVLATRVDYDSDGVPVAPWKLYYADGNQCGLEIDMPTIPIDSNAAGVGAEGVFALCFEVFEATEPAGE